MSVASSKAVDPHSTPRGMRSSKFDLVTSFLMSLMILLGSCVAVMLILWALTPASVAVPQSSPVSRISFAVQGTPDAEPEFEQPAPSEITSLAEPTLQETIDVVSSVQVNVVVNDFTGHSALSKGDPDGLNDTGSGLGDDRQDTNIVPRFERWNLNFSATGAAAYGRQLDALGIEIAIFGGGLSGIDCLKNLSGDRKHYQIDAPQHEQRLYFSWVADASDRHLIRYELDWLTKASIRTQNRHLIKFIPQPLESKLARAELEYARKHGVNSVRQIAKTVFESRPSADGFQLHVIHQRYRTARN